jgi:hypothetical protein
MSDHDQQATLGPGCAPRRADDRRHAPRLLLALALAAWPGVTRADESVAKLLLLGGVGGGYATASANDLSNDASGVAFPVGVGFEAGGRWFAVDLAARAHGIVGQGQAIAPSLLLTLRATPGRGIVQLGGGWAYVAVDNPNAESRGQADHSTLFHFGFGWRATDRVRALVVFDVMPGTDFSAIGGSAFAAFGGLVLEFVVLGGPRPPAPPPTPD